MLCNHGWEKQQTQRPKGSGPKGSGRQRNPPKEILPRVKRTTKNISRNLAALISDDVKSKPKKAKINK